MTQLDAAYTAAKHDNNKKPDFYNLFLNTELYIATHETQEANSFSPLLMESNGIKYLMLFDTEERLANWAKKEVAYAAVPGHTLVETVGTDYHWALNAGTEFVKTFVPDEIQWLKGVVGKSKNDQAANDSTNVSVLIRKPVDLPEGFTEALTEELAKHAAINQAYLGKAHYAIKDEPPHLTLVLEVDTQMNTALRNELSEKIKTLLADDSIFDLLLSGESGVANEIVKAMEPCYNKS
jgi:hypothetical protein